MDSGDFVFVCVLLFLFCKWEDGKGEEEEEGWEGVRDGGCYVTILCFSFSVICFFLYLFLV